MLVTSLDQALLNREHIPALFFLAETCLYWLRTDAINQPYLRTAELKLLRMGQLVFTRLFYHHMAGQLQRHDEFKNRLFTYLDGVCSYSITCVLDKIMTLLAFHVSTFLNHCFCTCKLDIVLVQYVIPPNSVKF